MSKLSLVQPVGDAIEKVLMAGDLSGLDVNQRLTYINGLCHTLGLNPLTKPFEYIKFQGKTILYATRNCTDQLRMIHGVSIDSVVANQVGDLYVVTVSASIGNRKDSATGALVTKGLGGEALANACMKCETKAKRRVTLSICGLGLLDESEVESAQAAVVSEKVIEANQRLAEPPKIEGPEGDSEQQGLVAVKTAYGEREKQQRLKTLGFKWDASLKLWTNTDLSVVEQLGEIEHEYI